MSDRFEEMKERNEAIRAGREPSGFARAYRSYNPQVEVVTETGETGSAPTPDIVTFEVPEGAFCTHMVAALFTPFAAGEETGGQEFCELKLDGEIIYVEPEHQNDGPYPLLGGTTPCPADLDAAVGSNAWSAINSAPTGYHSGISTGANGDNPMTFGRPGAGSSHVPFLSEPGTHTLELTYQADPDADGLAIKQRRLVVLVA